MKKVIIKFDNEMGRRLGLDILSYAGCRDIREEGGKLIGISKVPDQNWFIVEDYIRRRSIYGSIKVDVQDLPNVL